MMSRNSDGPAAASQGDLKLETDVARRLLSSAIPARLAYYRHRRHDADRGQAGLGGGAGLPAAAAGCDGRPCWLAAVPTGGGGAGAGRGRARTR